MQRATNWLETRWVVPAYSGWLMGGLAIFFFAAATNTMAGWLYAISGVMLALLGIGAILPARSLTRLKVKRHPIEPVSAGEVLRMGLAIANPTPHPKMLLQATDHLPQRLGPVAQVPIEFISANSTYVWRYEQLAERRGVYRWQHIDLRTAAPLGLFWCRRSRGVPVTAVVYPTVLPLSHCPLIDEMGQDLSKLVPSDRQAYSSTEGVTRTLRPYRWGDPTRLIHWRTSARYGELRIRELETYTGGQEIAICLDSASDWNADDFEQAVVAAASLYSYAANKALRVNLWTAGTGLLRRGSSMTRLDQRLVLEVLAAVSRAEEPAAETLPNLPLLWLTQAPQTLKQLPRGSRWLLWGSTMAAEGALSSQQQAGLVVRADAALQSQLQKPLR